MTRSIFVYALFVAACAKGGQSGGDDQPADDAAPMQQIDASNMPPRDGMMPGDASVPISDATAPAPDAPPGSIFCSSNSMCTVAGQCCFTLGQPMGFCTPGTVVLGQCVPQ